MTTEEKLIFTDNACSYDFEEARKNCAECRECDEDELSDSEVWEHIYNDIQFSYECEQTNLDKETNGIFLYADNGWWNGRSRCVVDTQKTNLNTVLDSLMRCDSTRKVYCDKDDVCVTEAHHDGTNNYIYREWKEDVTEEQKEEFMARCMQYGFDSEEADKYTNSLRPMVAEIYGW